MELYAMYIEYTADGKFEILSQAKSKDAPKFDQQHENHLKGFISRKLAQGIYTDRTQDYKLHVHKVSEKSPEANTYLVYLAEINIPSELLTIQSDQETQWLAATETKEEMEQTLAKCIEEKLGVLVKMESVNQITKDLTLKANQALDSNDLEKSQSYLKMAQEIPQLLLKTIGEAKDELDRTRYKQAGKAYKEAAKLAAKIDEDGLAEFLKIKADQAKNLPKLEKKLDSYHSKFNDYLDELNDLPFELFTEIDSTAKKLMEIYDQLENDMKIKQLEQLGVIIQEGLQIAERLSVLAAQIKTQGKKIA